MKSISITGTKENRPVRITIEGDDIIYDVEQVITIGGKTIIGKREQVTVDGSKRLKGKNSRKEIMDMIKAMAEEDIDGDNG